MLLDYETSVMLGFIALMTIVCMVTLSKTNAR